MTKISIITPAYNCVETINDTYKSIANQTHTDWEWIVTEDCSNDNTLMLLIDLQKNDKRVKILKNDKNSGAAVSRNSSMAASTGNFIAFLDSDDLWKFDKLEKQIAFMQSYNYDFTFTSYEVVDEKGTSRGQTVDLTPNLSVSYTDMLKKKATLGCSTVMLRKSAFRNLLEMPLIRTGQDYALWLKLLKSRKGVNAYCLNEVLTSYRISPNSISRNKYKKAKRQWQIYREIEGLSLSSSIHCFIFYAWRAVFRK